jgi:hypothetical protein
VAVVLEAAVSLHQLIEHCFAFVAEWRMTEVVSEGDGFGKVFVKLERAGNVARDARNFHRVGQPRAQVIAGAVEENLRLVFEAAKCARVNDAIPITLVLGAPLGRRFNEFSTARVATELRVRREGLPFDLFQFFSRAGHEGKLKTQN